MPAWMMVRLSAGLNDNTRLVIFEPGPNDKNKSSSVENSEKILSFLHERQMPTIYISHSAIQTVEEGLQTATKFGAYYYGDWIKGVPVDRVHRQYDKGTGGGHMTAEGCQLWAKNTLPLVKQIILKKNIK